MIDVKITFDAGSNKDGGLKGLSMLTHNLLDEGTTKMNSEEIASSFESTGASFSTSVNKDKSSISLRSLRGFHEISLQFLLESQGDNLRFLYNYLFFFLQVRFLVVYLTKIQELMNVLNDPLSRSEIVI